MKEPWTLSVGRVLRYTFTALAMVAEGPSQRRTGAARLTERLRGNDPVLGWSGQNFILAS